MSLIIVLGLNFTLTIFVITGFTWCQYFRHRKKSTHSKHLKMHSDDLLNHEEEKSKMIDDFNYPFGPSITNEADTLSSSSLTNIDFNTLNRYKDKRKVLPKLDPWLFKWIYQIYKINDMEIFQFTPVDGYLYLYFLKGASFLFFILTVLNWGILIPIYSGEGRQGAKNDLQIVTIGNIVNDSQNSRMWAVFSVTIIVSLVTYIFYIQTKEKNW